MLVELLGVNPIWTLFTVIGILTLFGKKKDDKKEEASTGGSPSLSTPSQEDLGLARPASNAPTPAVTPPSTSPSYVTGPYQAQRPWSSPLSPAAMGDEDSSLSRLLQSLLKDMPPEDVSEPSGTFSLDNAREWVPPRATPASRPMVITPGGKSPDQNKLAPSPAPAAVPTVPWNPQAPPSSAKPSPPAGETPKPASQPKVSTPPPAPEKPAQPAKQEAPKRPPAPKAAQSFDHIFELTQGSFESPGLIVVNGPVGSGKTTLCSGLVNSFLKQGNPCMFVTYDKAPSALRDQMKKLSFDPSESESNYRLLLVDGFSSQSDSFSFEPYYVEKAFDFDSIQDALTKNTSMFIGEKPKVIFDSMDQVVAKTDPKDFVKKLGETMDKLRDSSVTLVATIDLSKAPKDVVKWLEDTAACVIDLEKDDSDPDGRELKVRKLNGSNSKIDAETFEIDSGKGLVFVK